MAFGDLASRYPEAGGLYVYLREAWGPRVAFLYGWQCLLLMDPGITAALALGLSGYLGAMWPAAAGRERWLALGAVWSLALLNMAGLRLSSRMLNLLTAIKVLALAAIVLGALTVGSGSWSHFVPFASRRAGAPPLSEALGLGMIGAFYSFGGFWEASRVAGEMRDPRRQLPRALALGVATVTLAYVLTTLAFVYLVPVEGAVDSRTFAARAGTALLGARGPAVLAGVVVLSAGASAMALMLMAPRLYIAMSRDGLFPEALAAIHPATKAPVRATVLLASLASVFVLSGTFSQIVAFFMATTLVFIALAAAGVLVVRSREPGAAGAASSPAAPAAFVLLGDPADHADRVLVQLHQPRRRRPGRRPGGLRAAALRRLQDLRQTRRRVSVREASTRVPRGAARPRGRGRGRRDTSPPHPRSRRARGSCRGNAGRWRASCRRSP